MYSSSLGLWLITFQIIYFEKNQGKIRQALAKNPFWSIRKLEEEFPVGLNNYMIYQVKINPTLLFRLFPEKNKKGQKCEEDSPSSWSYDPVTKSNIYYLFGC